MALELQLSRSKYFYGRVMVNGREKCFSLRVPVKGTPPQSMRDLGDALFERQRALAQAKLDQLAEELRGRGTREELTQRILEARTGSRLGSVPLSQLAAKWREIPRSRALAPRYVQSCEAVFQRFCGFIKKRCGVTEMNQVDEAAAEAFMRSEADRKISGKTYNDVLILLRSCFERLGKVAGIAENPFARIPLRQTRIISRIPFTPDEVERLLVAASTTPEFYPLIAVGISTALRLGDAARLRWESLDLTAGFVAIKRTGKTGAEVTIPILEPLRKALEGLQPQEAGYVFPSLAKMYTVNPSALTDAVRKIFATAGFAKVNEDRADGLRRASVRDFASLRTTWVTIAINSGVPAELVIRVTGHRTVEMVRSHYHQPAREDFQHALKSKLPPVFTSKSRDSAKAEDTKNSHEDFAAILRAMSDDNWRALRDTVLKALENR